MLDPVFVADAIEDVVEGISVVGVIGELDTPFDCLPAAVAQDRIVGQHGVDGVGYGCDQVAQELGGDHLAGFLMLLDERELAGAVDRDEQA